MQRNANLKSGKKIEAKSFAVMKVFINSIPKANITAETTTSKNKGILKSSTATIVTLKQPKRINIKKPVTLNEKDTISGFGIFTLNILSRE